MPLGKSAAPLLKTLHLLSICAWIGGGTGIVLLLSLDWRAGTPGELQAYNRVIDAMDDWIIAPGGIATLASGLLLAHVRRIPVTPPGILRVKLCGTATAIAFGLFFVAPRLERLLVYSCRDNLAVFDDRLYSTSFLAGTVGCAVQSVLVLGLLIVSVLRPRLFARKPQPAEPK